MLTFGCRKDGSYYIRATGDYHPVNTYQLTKQGAKIIKSSGNTVGVTFSDQLFFLLHDLGHISTNYEENLDSKLRRSDAFERDPEELSVKDRVDILTQITEVHSVETLYLGEAGEWVCSLVNESSELIQPLLISITQASGYSMPTIIIYNRDVENGEKILEVALCAFLQIKRLRDCEAFEDDHGNKSDRTVLGIDRDFVFIETSNEDVFAFGMPGEMPGEIHEKLKSLINPVWRKGIGVAGFAGLISMEVGFRYDVENGIILPRSRLDDFPVEYSPRSANMKIPPNEFAELHDRFLFIHSALPNDVDPLWKFAIESILFEEEGLASGIITYTEQLDYADFTLSGYRTVHGDGKRLTDFPAIATGTPSEQDQEYVDKGTQLPVAPESGQVIPLNPGPEELEEAFALLNEFPTTPSGEHTGRGEPNLLDPSKFPGLESTSSKGDRPKPTDSDTEPETDSSSTDRNLPSNHGTTSTSPNISVEDDPSTEPDSEEPNGNQSVLTSKSETTVLRQEGPSGQTSGQRGKSNTDHLSSPKYDDPQAQQAHQRAQQRDPSDIVELGEEISLVIKEADHRSRPPTIVGTKNRLVIFVNDVPQDVSKHDTIQVKIIDYGGKNNSAEAVFVDYER